MAKWHLHCLIQVWKKIKANQTFILKYDFSKNRHWMEKKDGDIKNENKYVY